MAQAMIDFKKLKEKRTVSTQTGLDSAFCISLTKSKNARLYYSESYKDFVVSFNFSCSKKFIISRSMWKIFRKYINQIDNELNK